MPEKKKEYRIIIISPFEKTPDRVIAHRSLEEARGHGESINKLAGFKFRIESREVSDWVVV